MHKILDRERKDSIMTDQALTWLYFPGEKQQ